MSLRSLFLRRDDGHLHEAEQEGSQVKFFFHVTNETPHSLNREMLEIPTCASEALHFVLGNIFSLWPLEA